MPGLHALRRILNASRDAAQQGGLPVAQQLVEMVLLKLLRDLGPIIIMSPGSGAEKFPSATNGATPTSVNTTSCCSRSIRKGIKKLPSTRFWRKQR